MKFLVISILILFVFSCEYPQVEDVVEKKTNFSVKNLPLRNSNLRRENYDAGENLKNGSFINYDAGIFSFDSNDIVGDTLTFFSLPGDLTCDGIDDNLNGYTDEDCIKYLELSGDAGVFPGYIISRSPHFRFKGYYWVSSQ